MLRKIVNGAALVLSVIFLGAFFWQCVIEQSFTLVDLFGVVMALVFCDRLVTLSPWLEQESIYPRLGMVIAIYLCSAPMAWGLTSAEIKRFPNDMIEAYLGISTFGTIAFGVLLFIRSCIQSFEKETPTE